jgi:hypothetical protein|tara:strand:- start:500 stop:742 length:243 start_codon:yes stop_codon:yes gene_type:complete
LKEDQSFSADNLIAVSSRIQSAEFMAEKAALSRTQLLLQVVTSILAQADAAHQKGGKDVPASATYCQLVRDSLIRTHSFH